MSPSKKPSRRRGAAMVEAATVLPVLVSFLGVGTMMYRGYQTKLDANQGIRSAALDFAAHDCAGTAGPVGLGAGGKSAVSKSEAKLPGPNRVGGNDESQALQGRMAERPAMSGESGFAEASYGARTVANPYGGHRREGQGPSLTVHGERSVTLCNEAPMDGDIGSMASTVTSEVSKAAGSTRSEQTRRSDFETKD